MLFHHVEFNNSSSPPGSLAPLHIVTNSAPYFAPNIHPNRAYWAHVLLPPPPKPPQLFIIIENVGGARGGSTEGVIL